MILDYGTLIIINVYVRISRLAFHQTINNKKKSILSNCSLRSVKCDIDNITGKYVHICVLN